MRPQVSRFALLATLALLHGACRGPARTEAPRPPSNSSGQPTEATARLSDSERETAFRTAVEAHLARDALLEALAVCQRWTRANPDSGEAWLLLAQCLIDPDTPPAHRDPARAAAAAARARAASLEPNARVLVTLGTAQYLAGDVRGALATYRQALRAPDLDCADELSAFVDELERG